MKISAWIAIAVSSFAWAQSDRVVVRPVEIDDVLVNPGRGIQTFQRYNGDPVNSGQGWTEAGPTEKTRAATRAGRPDFPESSLAYFRWFWRQLEPEQGRYRWDVIDRALEEARKHNQKLTFRLMPYDEGNPLPEWYRKSGARRANSDADKVWKAWAPDADDPLYLKFWGAFVRAAGARYDGHPYLDSVDISTVGYWGEGWGPYLPGWHTQQALVDLYFEAFPRTPLMINFDEPNPLIHATRNGAGWRLDCWGDMGETYWDSWGRKLSHMLDVYPEQLARTGTSSAWQRGPVSLETCWVAGYWKDRGWDIDYILDQALRWHATSINLKSSAIPPEWKEKFREFEKKLGYRFVLRRVEYPKKAVRGGMMTVNMWWLNKGVAPVYHPYTLAVQLESRGQGPVLRTPAEVNKWLPGDAVFDGSLYVPQDLAPGTYRFRVALLDPRTGLPGIRLAIQGRQNDGWYDLGPIELE